MFYSLISILYLILLVYLIVHLAISGVRPTKTLAWMIVIILIPVIGIALYLMLGRNLRKYKFTRRKPQKNVEVYVDEINKMYDGTRVDFSSSVLQQNRKLIHLISKNSNFLPSGGNKLQLLTDGPETFHSMMEAMESARLFIHVQFYIYEEGELAEKFARIFREKVEEGVEVRLIIDGVGSRNLSKAYIRRLQSFGVQVLPFLPLRFWGITTWINYRNHRKILIVDDLVGFIGGINLSDKYIKGDPLLGTWHDHHLKLEGPSVSSLQAVFAMDWLFVNPNEDLLQPRYLSHPECPGTDIVQIVFSGPDSDFSSVQQQYFTFITQAEEYIYLVNSYLIPGEPILEALTTAALSGVDVRIMVPEQSDIFIVKWSIRSYFESLLDAGIKIYLYQDGFLHSKTLVADDNISSIGTANLDIRSFEQNFEVNAVIYGKEMAQKLKASFDRDSAKCTILDKETYRDRPLSHRIIEGFSRMLSPIL